jgi:valyl-tRNA synthetase
MKIGRRLAMKIFNASKFVLAHSVEAGEIYEPLDLAFLAKLQIKCEDAGKSFEGYEPAQALSETEKFFWSHFTDSYLELVKVRTWGEKTSAEEKKAKASAVFALRFGLKTFLKLFAPFLPFITEEVWRWAFSEESKSIHQAAFPSSKDFSAIPAGDPVLFDAAMAAQTAINQQKTLSKVSIARGVTTLKLKAHPDTIKALTPVWSDVAGATKTERLDTVADPEAVLNFFTVEHIEYGPDLKA